MQTKPHINSIAWASSITLIIAIIMGTGLILHLRSKNASLEGANRSLNSEIEMRKTREGRMVADIQAGKVRIKDLEHHLPDLKQTISWLEVELKRVRAVNVSQFEARGKGNATITRIPYDTGMHFIDDSSLYLNADSGRIRYKSDGRWMTFTPDTAIHIVEGSFSHTPKWEPFAIVIDDGYLSLQADVYNEYQTPYQYVYSDTLSTVFHMKGKWWQKKELYSSSMLRNKNAQVVGGKAVLVDEYKDKRWGIGPCVSYGLGPGGAQWNVGLSVHYSIIKF